MLILFFLLLATNEAQIPQDKITSLPGYKGNLGTQYSGFIQVDKNHNRQLHYWFVESKSQPSSDPLILWLNGGPGCSSLDGLLYEHGPFKFAPTSEVQLVDNPWSWNNKANVLYLESPAGVGFSYSNVQSDYVTNDLNTTSDNYQFLKLWFQSYSKFRSNDFYIAGESYAGVYVPWLAREVQEGILKGTFKIPFKGILVGNGVSNSPGADGLQVYVPFLYGHGVVSDKLHKKIQDTCGSAPHSEGCSDLKNEAYYLANGLNMYGIYYDCFSQRPRGVFGEQLNVGGQVPCIDSGHADTFLNSLAVKKAIHVNATIKWSICNDFINENYDRTSESTVPIHKFLLKNGIRVLIYSGDTDFAVPYKDSEYWTSTAGLTETSPWHQWTYTDAAGAQVAGMATVYQEGLSFVTVKGAGHMVPQYAPQRAHEMLQKFLSGTPF